MIHSGRRKGAKACEHAWFRVQHTSQPSKPISRPPHSRKQVSRSYNPTRHHRHRCSRASFHGNTPWKTRSSARYCWEQNTWRRRSWAKRAENRRARPRGMWRPRGLRMGCSGYISRSGNFVGLRGGAGWTLWAWARGLVGCRCGRLRRAL